jgi:hypothetical protein
MKWKPANPTRWRLPILQEDPSKPGCYFYVVGGLGGARAQAAGGGTGQVAFTALPTKSPQQLWPGRSGQPVLITLHHADLPAGASLAVSDAAPFHRGCVPVQQHKLPWGFC